MATPIAKITSNKLLQWTIFIVLAFIIEFLVNLVFAFLFRSQINEALLFRDLSELAKSSITMNVCAGAAYLYIMYILVPSKKILSSTILGIYLFICTIISYHTTTFTQETLDYFMFDAIGTTVGSFGALIIIIILEIKKRKGKQQIQKS